MIYTPLFVIMHQQIMQITGLFDRYQEYLTWLGIAIGIFLIFLFIRRFIAGWRIMKYSGKGLLPALQTSLLKRPGLNRRMRLSLRKGNYSRAGQLYQEMGDYRKALKTYGKGGADNLRADLLLMLGRGDEAVEIYKSVANTDGLLKCYLAMGQIEKAGVLLEDMDRHQEAADLFKEHGFFEHAAQLYSNKGLFCRAAEIFLKMEKWEMAAYNYERWITGNKEKLSDTSSITDFEKNLMHLMDLYLRLNQPQKAFSLLNGLGRTVQAAEMALKFEDFPKAAQLFKKAGEIKKAAEIFEKTDDIESASLLRAQIARNAGKSLEAAEWFVKGKSYRSAAEVYEAERHFEKAADCRFMAQEFAAAANNYLNAGKRTDAARMYEMDKQFSRAAELYLKEEELPRAAELYERGEEFYQAGLAFYRNDQEDRALKNLDQVSENDVNYVNSLLLMARIFLKQNGAEWVLKKIGPVLAENKPAAASLELKYLLARAHLEISEFKQARNLFQDILAQDYSYKDAKSLYQQVEQHIRQEAESESSDPALNSDRYQIITRIGEGGMGVVYKAKDRLLNRVVALKILNRIFTGDKLVLDNFYAEARSAASLSHPNIVTIFDLGQIDGDHFISMEFIQGENCMNLIKKHKFLKISQVLYIASKLFKALDYSHQRNLVHRDIKPHNIMITQQNEVKVMDFGLAIIRGEKKKGESGYITGTPYYMSPEQIQGEGVDFRSDIYSAGATLYHLITGQVPFSGDNIFYQHLFEPLPDMRNFNELIPLHLVKLVHRCMEKDRNNRYKNVNEVMSDLKQIKQS